MNEFLLQFFAYEHLPPHLRAISKPFHDLAHAIVNGDNTAASGTVTIGGPLPRNPERTTALRNLLEAKDCAVRAVLAGDLL
jgi:hypothetical protein